MGLTPFFIIELFFIFAFELKQTQMSKLKKEQIEEIIGRQKNLEYLLNQIVPKPRKWIPIPKEDLIEAREAAEYLGISLDNLNKIGRKGEINRYKVEGTINNAYSYSKSELKEFITGRRNNFHRKK